MKSLEHVMWRGALALGLVATGIGSGLGLPSQEQATSSAECAPSPRASIADAPTAIRAREDGVPLIVLRRVPNPAG